MFKGVTRDQKVLLWVLTLINLLNYLDRQVVFPLFGHLKIEFGLTDFHLGLLGTAFLLGQSLAAFPMGVLADRVSRRAIVGFGIAFWSLATFASGLAGSFKHLLGLRTLVGVGEASYVPAAVSMISDNFPDEHNSKIQGVFNVGMLVGGTLGAIIGGLVSYYFNSWRLAFFIVSVPGFILALWAFKIKDVRRLNNEPKVKLRSLLGNGAYLWIIASGTFISFANGAFITWGIEFITRYKDYNVRDASLILGFGMMISSVVGVLVGSYLADWLYKKYVWGRSVVVMASLLLATPLMFLGLADVGKNMFLVFFFGGAALIAVYLGPVTAVIHDITPKQFKASAFGLYVLFIHLVGESLAPSIIGKISDHFNLQVGLQVATCFVFLSGLCFIPVTYLIRKNHHHAEVLPDPIVI